MRVLHVASEVAPFAMSGGLADVMAGLPAAQADIAGVRAGVLVPLYRGVEAKIVGTGHALSRPVPLPLVVGPNTFGAALRTVDMGRVRIGFLDCPQLFDRIGTLYGPGGAGEWGDNHVRFGALGVAALDAAQIMFGGLDVLHVHDWQGGPAAVYARVARPDLRIVATIHNLAYRGIFPKTAMTDLGFPWPLFTQAKLEFWDQVSFLKGALALADVVTTVSPTYAKEILTPAFGEALDGFLVHDIPRVVGIVNGIDTRAWDPQTDPALPAHFSRQDLAGKDVCRRALAEEANLTLDEHVDGTTGPRRTLLAGVVARMTAQKGLDLVADIVPELHALGVKLVVLGAGEPELETRFRYLAETFADTLSVRVGFDLGYARRIYAGSDVFVMPSRFEPCGLGQLYAMRYGTIPIVHAVGGLADTVRDADAPDGTGFSFTAPTSKALLGSLERAVSAARDHASWTALRRQAMARDSSWATSANDYVTMYRTLR
ncbi:MAG: glycogen synthase GlgA [Kofleriaceae bacterium]